MKLNKKAFRTWLKSRPQCDIVGESGNPWACPLATFLFDTTGNASLVSAKMYSDSKWNETPLPQWAQAFISTIDCADDYFVVTRERALQVLDDWKYKV